jgi:tripartite-type tricarboxylate transporter receptor subunit TctC
MRILRSQILPAPAVLSLALITAQAALAQDYPTQPITVIVPYAASGGNDVCAASALDR